MKKVLPQVMGIGLAIVGLLLVYQSYGYKLTTGNIIGLRVSRIALVDTTLQKAYDDKGNPISMDDPFVSDYKNPNRKDRIFSRKAIFNVPGAAAIRVSFLGMPGTTSSSSSGKIDAGFPVEDSTDSTPYQVEATADDWQVIDVWNSNNPSKYMTVEEQADSMKENGVPVPSVSVSAKNLPSNDPNNLGEDFMISFEPSANGDSGWSTVRGENRFIHDSIKGKLSDFKRITIKRRSYKIIETGILAFGAKGDSSKVIQPNHQVKLLSIRNPRLNPNGSGEQWTPEGKLIPYQPYLGTYIAQGSGVPGQSAEGFRFFCLDFLVGEFDSGITLQTTSKLRTSGTTFGKTGRIINGMAEYFLGIGTNNAPEKADIDLSMGIGPFSEVARCTNPSYTKLGLEPEGTFVVEDNTSRDKGKPIVFRSFFIKIPKGLDDHELRASWISADGSVHDYAGTIRIKSHIGVQFSGPPTKQHDVAGIILKSRKFKHFQFKDVHLKPLPAAYTASIVMRPGH